MSRMIPLCLLTFGLCVANVNAGIMTFTNQGAFNAATSGSSFTLQNFNSATPGNLTKGVNHNFGGFTARADGGGTSSFYIAPNPFTGAQHPPFTASQHLGWAEDGPFSNGSTFFGPTITITFDNPQSAVSFDFLDSDGTDEYRLFVDGTEVSFPSAISDTDQAFFFGITNDMGGITELQFTTQGTNPGGFVEEFGIDNIRFAEAVVPEPASIAVWSLILLVGASFIVLRSRKSQPALN
ncbi:MAG: hypothetical protein Tsb009_38980 [Planctomycetaceae bacterium]